MSKLRTLEETETFQQQALEIGNPKVIDEALFALTCALAQRADVYPVVTGMKRLRVAKTYPREATGLPGLKVWFVIIDEDRVELRSITILDPGELED